MIQSNDSEDSASLTELSALLLSSLCTLLVLGWALWRVRFGVDFSDEGFYLVWISNPFKYSVSLSQFGYIYHPLYMLFDGNVAALRQANVLITFGLTCVATFEFLGVCFKRLEGSLFTQFIVSAALATASLVFYRQWLPTPSYNSLSLQAVMLVTIGLMRADRKLDFRSLAGWVLIGIGVWLAFMAKPTVSLALGLSSIVYLLVARKANSVGAGFSIITCVLSIVFYAQVVDGSLVEFYERISEGLRLAQLLSSDYGAKGVLRIDSFSLSGFEWWSIGWGAVTLATLILLSQQTNRVCLTLWRLVFVTIFLVIIAVVLGDSRVFEPQWSIGETLTLMTRTLWTHLILWSVPLGLLISIVFSGKQWVCFSNLAKKQWPLLLLTLLLPYSFAFGTGSNYWFYQGLSGVFWVFSGLVIMSSGNPHGRTLELLSVAIGVQFVAAVILLVAVQDPYYQPGPLRQADYKIDFGKPGSVLILPKNFGEYISDALEQSRNAGFERGMPMIDLTGRSPGVLYALGASSTGSAWIYGNYANSGKTAHISAAEMLKGVECEELARAWLLVEPDGPVNISPDVLSVFGADFYNDYKAVGEFETRPSVGGFPVSSNQVIFMPVRTMAKANMQCAESRDL